MPLSLIPTFAIMAPMGQSLNGISLLALSLTIGILVDDAIVEIENIVRHMRQGNKQPYEAAMEAADEIGLAVVATTATIVAGYVLFFFAPMDMIWIGAAGLLLFTGQSFVVLLMLVFITDCIEYGHWKLGTRNAAVGSTSLVGRATLRCGMVPP